MNIKKSIKMAEAAFGACALIAAASSCVNIPEKDFAPVKNSEYSVLTASDIPETRKATPSTLAEKADTKKDSVGAFSVSEGQKSEELVSEGLESEKLESEELKSEKLKSEEMESEESESEGSGSEGLGSEGAEKTDSFNSSGSRGSNSDSLNSNGSNPNSLSSKGSSSGQSYSLGSEGVEKSDKTKTEPDGLYRDDKGIRLRVSGKDIHGGFYLINKHLYYFDKNGYAVTGWLEQGGIQFFFDPEGIARHGWIEDEEGRKYYLLEGRKYVGWHDIEDEEGRKYSYYFDEDGVLYTGRATPDGYFVNDQGHRVVLSADGDRESFSWNKDRSLSSAISGLMIAGQPAELYMLSTAGETSGFSNIGAIVAGDNGRAYGICQFDYRYDLVNFMNFAYRKHPGLWAGFAPYLSLEAGDERLVYNEDIGNTFLSALKADFETAVSDQLERFADLYWDNTEAALNRAGFHLESRSIAVSAAIFSIDVNCGPHAALYLERLSPDMSDEEMIRELYHLRNTVMSREIVQGRLKNTNTRYLYAEPQMALDLLYGYVTIDSHVNYGGGVEWHGNPFVEGVSTIANIGHITYVKPEDERILEEGGEALADGGNEAGGLSEGLSEGLSSGISETAAEGGFAAGAREGAAAGNAPGRILAFEADGSWEVINAQQDSDVLVFDDYGEPDAESGSSGLPLALSGDGGTVDNGTSEAFEALEDNDPSALDDAMEENDGSASEGASAENGAVAAEGGSTENGEMASEGASAAGDASAADVLSAENLTLAVGSQGASSGEAAEGSEDTNAGEGSSVREENAGDAGDLGIERIGEDPDADGSDAVDGGSTGDAADLGAADSEIGGSGGAMDFSASDGSDGEVRSDETENGSPEDSNDAVLPDAGNADAGGTGEASEPAGESGNSAPSALTEEESAGEEPSSGENSLSGESTPSGDAAVGVDGAQMGENAAAPEEAREGSGSDVSETADAASGGNAEEASALPQENYGGPGGETSPETTAAYGMEQQAAESDAGGSQTESNEAGDAGMAAALGAGDGAQAASGEEEALLDLTPGALY